MTPPMKSTAGSNDYLLRRRIRRLLLLSAVLCLAACATGCQSILADILSGDTCADHAVCAHKAAAAGTAAAAAGGAAAFLQRKEDSPSEPWPWEKDEAEMDRELEELTLKEEKRSSKDRTEKPSEESRDEEKTEPDAGTETETEPGAKGERETKPPAEEPETKPESEPETESGEGGGKEAPAEEEKTPSARVEKPEKREEKKPEEDKKKVKSPVEKYIPVTTVGDVTVLVNPENGKVAVGGGTFIGGKDENGYWITQDGKIVVYDEKTGNATISDKVFTLEREGKSYTLTSGDKLLSYDGKGGFEASDGHFTVARDGSAFGITKDNKVVAYDRATGEFILSDGRFTIQHEDTSYTVTKDNKVITFDRASGNFKVSDGHFTLQRENSVTVFTKDKTQLTFNEREGTGSVRVWGRKGEVTVGAGRQGNWLVNGKVKGSIDGTPTTFKVSAEQYRLPDTSGSGFRGGVDIQQKNFGLTLNYGKDDVSRTFSADVRNRDWTVGFSRQGDDETYRAGWRKVFVSYGREAGGHVSMAGYTHRF